MSEETILILNMLRDGKLTVDEAERLLGAVAPSVDAAEPPPSPVPPVPPVPPIPPIPPTPPPPMPPPFSNIVAAVQSRLGDLQGRLGSLQGEIIAGAAAAHEAGSHNSRPNNWGKLDFGSVLDETVRDLSSLRDETMRTAKRAVREAAVQGRAAAFEARQAARKAGADLRDGVRVPGFGATISFRWSERPHNAGGLPEVSDDVDVEEALGDCFKLRIQNPLGSVTIIGGGAPGEIRGTLKRTVWAGTHEEAQNALSTLQAVFHIDGDVAILEVPFPGESQEATADLELTLPSSLPVSVETLHGDLRIEGIGSAFSGSTQSGDITANNAVAIAGDALFQTASGDIRLEDWDVPSGILTMQTTTGDITVRDAAVSGGFRVATQSGDVLLEAIEAEIVDVGSASGDVRLMSNSIKGTASVRSQSGSVRLEDMRALHATLESVSGEISLRNSSTSAVVSTTSGDVDVAVMGQEVTVKTVSGDADVQVVGPFSGTLLANTVSGDLKIALPETTGAWLDIATTSGEIETKITLQERQANDSRRLAGRIGDGTGTVRLRTISGDISVEPSNYP